MLRIPKLAKVRYRVANWVKYSQRKRRLKTMLSRGKSEFLTRERHEALMRDYHERAAAALMKVDRVFGRASKVTVSEPFLDFKVAKEIANDFKRVKGLRVCGFGVGYGQLQFFLKLMGAKTKGVELNNLLRPFTEKAGLDVTHNKSAADPSLREFGKFDVTY